MAEKVERDFPRREFPWQVAYNESDGDVTKAVSAEMVNISTDGACIVADIAPKPKKIIILRVPISDYGVSVPSVTEVVWSKALEDGRFKAGLKFLV